MSKMPKNAEKYNQYVQCVLFEYAQVENRSKEKANIYKELHEGMELSNYEDGSYVIGDKEVILKEGIIQKIFNAVVTDQQMELII